jgi:hypothetical protein
VRRFAVLFVCGLYCAEFPSFGSAQVQEKQSERVHSQVNYVGRVTALDAIVAVGLQTHTPIGIVPGRDTKSLCRSQYPFDLGGMDVSAALLDIAHRAQYSLAEENGVFIITASDTTPRQLEVLGHRFKEFKPGTEQTMHMLTFQLSGWLWAEVAHGEGYGGSILDNPAAPKISLPPVLENITTQEIADRVITNGKGGMWISKINPDSAKELDDFSIEFESYGDADQLKREILCRW